MSVVPGNEAYPIEIIENNVRIETCLLILEEERAVSMTEKGPAVHFPQIIEHVNIQEIIFRRDYIQIKLVDRNTLYRFETVFVNQILYYFYKHGIKLTNLVDKRDPGYIDYTQLNNKILLQQVHLDGRLEDLTVNTNNFKCGKIRVYFIDICSVKKDDYNFKLQINTVNQTFQIEFHFKVRQIFQ